MAPWYRNPSTAHPFKLAASATLPTRLRSTACFPWDAASFSLLWDGRLKDSSGLSLAKWNNMIAEYSDRIAVGGKVNLVILSTHIGRKPSISVTFDGPEATDETEYFVNVAWALNETNPLDPLVLFSASGLLCVYSVKEEKIVGKHRGHGGEITSIAVHPTRPNLFCTTSRDYTTRLYDLNLAPLEDPKNPHWPPTDWPTMSGAPSGLHSLEIEDMGLGRCIAIFVGGLGNIGGHAAAVLGAGFHPTLPILVTCGLDRAINIWRIPPTPVNSIAREYRPLFNSTDIHQGRVLSVTWISEDMLLSHSSATLIRTGEKAKPDISNIPGTIVVFQWTGLHAYFPEEHRHEIPYPMRGVLKDSARSNSYRIVATYTTPMLPDEDSIRRLVYSPRLTLSRMLTGDPLIAFASSDSVYILNVGHFKPNRQPPNEFNGELATKLASQLTITDDRMEDGVEDERDISKLAWVVKANSTDEVLYGCSIGLDGRAVMAVGSKLHIWTVAS